MKAENKITILNILSMVILQGIALFTTPLFTRMLGAEQYGKYSVFNSWVAILTCIMGVGVQSSIGTGLYEFKDKYYEFRNSVLLLGTIISGVIFLAGCFAVKFLSAYLGYNYCLISVLFLSAMSHFIINFIQGACIYEKRAELNFVLSVAMSFITVGLSVFLIYWFPEDRRFLGRVYGTAIPYVVFSAIMWLLFFLKKPTGIHKNYCRYGLVIGLPVVFHSLSQNILEQSDRVMMQQMGISNTEIGIYSLFYTFTAVTSTILSALNNSWCPFYYDDVDAKNWDKLNTKCKNYIELFSVIVVGFLLLSREVSYLLAGSEYWKGIAVIPVLVIAVYFTFMYQFPVNFEFFHRKTYIIAVGTCGAAAANIILNIILIPVGGMYGAAFATTLSYGLLFVAHYFIVTHMKEYSYHLRLSVFLPGLVAVTASVIVFYVFADVWLIRWLLGIAAGGYEINRVYKRKSVF